MEDLEEEEQDVQPEANGSAVPKAPAPEAAEETARTMSIGDQIAFGKRNVASLFQVTHPALFNPKTSVFIRLFSFERHHPCTGNLNSETLGDSKNVFLH